MSMKKESDGLDLSEALDTLEGAIFTTDGEMYDCASPALALVRIKIAALVSEVKRLREQIAATCKQSLQVEKPICPQPGHGKKFMHGDTLLCMECGGLVPAAPERLRESREPGTLNHEARCKCGAMAWSPIGMEWFCHYCITPMPPAPEVTP